MSGFTTLGLLGHAGSGKDMVADWFVEKGYVKVAFADPLKRFVRDVFSFTSDQLWGESDKRNEEIPVDESWWLSAVERLNVSVGEILNDIIDEGDRVQGFTDLYKCFTGLRSEYGTKISPRVILQTLGTNWGRKLDPLMWVRYAHKIAHQLETGDYTYSQDIGLTKTPLNGQTYNMRGVIIPDHRFLNEIWFTRAQPSSYVIKIKRLAKPEGTLPGISNHASEEEQKGIPDNAVDLVLAMEEGKENVYKVLEEAYEKSAWMIKYEITENGSEKMEDHS